MAIKSSSIMLVVLAMVTLMATSSKAQPPLGITSALITGIVNCSINASSSAPPFPNATVQLQCGGTTVASTVTSSSGTFSITLGSQVLPSILSSLQSGGCNVNVTTPLVACNATLPATGNLVALVVPVVSARVRVAVVLIFTIDPFAFAI